MKKIALIIPMLQPYRISFYRDLVNSNQDTEIKIFHGITNNSGRPNYKGEVGFNEQAFYPQRIELGPWKLYFNKKLKSILKDFDPDLIIMYGNPGVITNHFIAGWANRNDIKVCLWVCSWDSGKSEGIFRKIKKSVATNYYNKADYFIAYSSHAKNYLIDHGQNPNEIAIAYNGLDISGSLEKYERIVRASHELRNENDLGDEFLFLYVGGLLKDKKVPLLIRAFNEISSTYKRVSLWIVGDGPEKSTVQNMIKNNSKIKYWGRIVDEVDKYFAAANCFVLPGAGGLALNQALFWKIPCIASSFADGTEEDLVLDEKTGFRFKKEDKNDLRQSMSNMIKMSKDSRREMGEEGYELIVDRSNTDEMLKEFNNVISKMLR